MCRWWPGIPAGRRRPCATARPAGWSTAATIEEIVEAISALLADPALARRMGPAGRHWISRDWNWDTHTARLAELLRVRPVRPLA